MDSRFFDAAFGMVIIKYILIIIVFVCISFGAGFFTGKTYESKGYLDGQRDCRMGVNRYKTIIKTDTLYTLKH